jgi:hypothetical protein
MNTRSANTNRRAARAPSLKPRRNGTLTLSTRSTKPDWPTNEITHQQIQELAYLLYLREGRPQGRHVQHWLEAETRLRQAVEAL